MTTFALPVPFSFSMTAPDYSVHSTRSRARPTLEIIHYQKNRPPPPPQKPAPPPPQDSEKNPLPPPPPYQVHSLHVNAQAAASLS
jgi:hypothetical protein